MASNTTIAILEASKKPSHRITIGRNAIFGIGNPTETIGSKNHRTETLRDHREAKNDAADRGNQKAGKRTIEREPGIDEEIARDGVLPDAVENVAQRAAA